MDHGSYALRFQWQSQISLPFAELQDLADPAESKVVFHDGKPATPSGLPEPVAPADGRYEVAGSAEGHERVLGSIREPEPVALAPDEEVFPSLLEDHRVVPHHDPGR